MSPLIAVSFPAAVTGYTASRIVLVIIFWVSRNTALVAWGLGEALVTRTVSHHSKSSSDAQLNRVYKRIKLDTREGYMGYFSVLGGN